MDVAALKSRARSGALPVLMLFVANVIVFHDYWTADRLFTGKDLLTAFGPLLNFQTDCLQDGSLPLWNPFLNFGYPFVEHYSNTLLFPTHLLMGLVTGSTMELIQREMLFWIFLGGLGTYLCARELGRSQAAALIAGMGFMFCGQVLELPHWHLLVYNAACFPFLLYGYFRAKRTGSSLSPVAILFLAFTLLGGHMTTSVLGAYMFAGFVLVDSLFDHRFRFGVRFLAMTCIAAGLLALPKLAPMFEAMRSGPRMLAPASLYTKDPFNVVNSYQFMGLLLPVKYFFSVYIGQLPILAAVVALLRRNLRINSLLILGILSSWFLMVDPGGNVSLIRSVSNVLPLMKLVRNEWLMWFYPSLFAILYLSSAVDHFLEEPLGRAHWAAAALFTVLLTTCYLLAYNIHVFAVPFVQHLCLTGVFVGLPLLSKRGSVQFAAVAGAVLLDFFLLFSFVAPDQPPVRDGKRLHIAVIDQGAISRSYHEDNSLRSGFFATAVQDRFRPAIADSVGWPVLQSGLHGAPFINYAPEQYGMFIDDMNLKRFSGWWYNGQERFDFIRLMDSGLLPATDGLPLMAFDVQSGEQRPAALSFEGITCSSFRFRTASATAGTFVLRQMFDDRWSATVDGAAAPVLRAEDFFMAVRLPPGEHTVAFRFRDRVFLAGLAVSGLTLAGLMGWGWYRRRRRPAPGGRYGDDSGPAAPGGA